MELTFLGTSSGTPTRARNVSAVALRHGGGRGWYLVDCGEGTQHQVLRTRLSLAQLRAIFITHVHGDHCFGLPGLLASAALAGRTKPLTLVAPQPVHRFVSTAIDAARMYLGYDLELVDVSRSGFSWRDAAVSVETVELSHRVPCWAYVFTEADRQRKLLVDKLRAEGVEAGPQWGRLQKGEDVTLADGRHLRSDDYTAYDRPPRKIIIAGDNDTPELLATACQDAHVLVHEATYSQDVADRVGPEPQHSSATRVARFAAQVGLPNLVLTHFSARYQGRHHKAPTVKELAEEARQFYRGNLVMAEDLATYRLDTELALMETE